MTSRRVVTLDLGGVADKTAFMDRFAQTLALPDWFGRNWDALADSLGDPSFWPPEAAENGLLLVVGGWLEYAAARPDEWAVALEVFTEASGRGPLLTVALALG